MYILSIIKSRRTFIECLLLAQINNIKPLPTTSTVPTTSSYYAVLQSSHHHTKHHQHHQSIQHFNGAVRSTSSKQCGQHHLEHWWQQVAKIYGNSGSNGVVRSKTRTLDFLKIQYMLRQEYHTPSQASCEALSFPTTLKLKSWVTTLSTCYLPCRFCLLRSWLIPVVTPVAAYSYSSRRSSLLVAVHASSWIVGIPWFLLRATPTSPIPVLEVKPHRHHHSLPSPSQCPDSPKVIFPSLLPAVIFPVIRGQIHETVATFNKLRSAPITNLGPPNGIHERLRCWCCHSSKVGKLHNLLSWCKLTPPRPKTLK